MQPPEADDSYESSTYFFFLPLPLTVFFAMSMNRTRRRYMNPPGTERVGPIQNP
jgi:hypothetical protein